MLFITLELVELWAAMGLPEDLWCAMHGVAAAARREKHPSKLRDLGKFANCYLECWRDASTSHFSGMARIMIFQVWQMSAFKSIIDDDLFPLTAPAVRKLKQLLGYCSRLDETDNNDSSGGDRCCLNRCCPNRWIPHVGDY